jgi:Zn ribbon nucleic-acid-binding protein
MIFVPIGVDCDVAYLLNKYNFRKMSLPFDWNVSYTGVAECIECDFNEYTAPLNESRVNKYDVYFHHDFEYENILNTDKEKYARRCERLLNILKENNETSGEHIMFIRKGHLQRHHEEQGASYSDIMKDICEAECLDSMLLNKYPNLKYKIILILGCTKCFNQDTTYNSKSKNIEIYNCIHNDEVRGKLFEECLFNVCNHSNTR